MTFTDAGDSLSNACGTRSYTISTTPDWVTVTTSDNSAYTITASPSSSKTVQTYNFDLTINSVEYSGTITTKTVAFTVEVRDSSCVVTSFV